MTKIPLTLVLGHGQPRRTNPVKPKYKIITQQALPKMCNNLHAPKCVKTYIQMLKNRHWQWGFFFFVIQMGIPIGSHIYRWFEYFISVPFRRKS